MTRPKLFYVEGLRHSAIVLAENEKQAIKLATQAHGNEKVDPRVLFGSVGDWEIFGERAAVKLKLPKGYVITRKSRKNKVK